MELRSVLASGTRSRPVVGAIGLALLVVSGGLVAFGSPASAPSHARASTALGPATVSTHFVQHVVVVVLENEVLKQVWKSGPYERYLGATYANVSKYFAACHPSAPNYLSMVSAETLQCGTDNFNRYNNATVLDLLQAKGFSWTSYAENLPGGTCKAPGNSTTSMFVPHHVPALFFRNVTSSLSFCRAHVRASTAFNSSVANGTLGNFSFYTPNMCDNGHNGCGGNSTNGQRTRQADAWLRNFLSPILNHTGRDASSAERAMMNHTAFLVLWDEGTGSSVGYSVAGISTGENYAWCQANGGVYKAVCGGHVFAVVVSPYSLGRNVTARDSTYGVAATIEWLFNLGHLGNPGAFDASKGFPAMSTAFSFRSNHY